MNRRQFNLTALASLTVKHMVAVQTPDSPLLVIQVEQPITAHACETLLQALKHAGLRAVVICTSPRDAILAESERTFFSAKHGDWGQVTADGQKLDRVLWCETTHGLVCLAGRTPADNTVRQYRKVTFVPTARRRVPGGTRPEHGVSRISTE